jgi:hypothetical protein
MKYLNILFICLLLVACEPASNTSTPAAPQAQAAIPRTIDWLELIPPGYSPDDIMAKYQERLNQLEDDDPQANVVYQQMMDEINNAPLNQQIDNQFIKLAGFIAPLVYQEGKVSEFLFVPYFGACIHVPPPPINQIIWVKTATGQEINDRQAYSPFWVSGTIRIQGQKTEIGEAGYRILDAITELYEYEEEPYTL